MPVATAFLQVKDRIRHAASASRGQLHHRPSQAV